MKLSIQNSTYTHKTQNEFEEKRNKSQLMRSGPSPGQVSFPSGQPDVPEACGGVSAMLSPMPS